jgi:hypothetical protein
MTEEDIRELFQGMITTFQNGAELRKSWRSSPSCRTPKPCTTLWLGQQADLRVNLRSAGLTRGDGAYVDFRVFGTRDHPGGRVVACVCQRCRDEPRRNRRLRMIHPGIHGAKGLAWIRTMSAKRGTSTTCKAHRGTSVQATDILAGLNKGTSCSSAFDKDQSGQLPGCAAFEGRPQRVRRQEQAW